MIATTSFVLGILALATGTPSLLPLTLPFAPVILTAGCVVALLRQGR